MSVVSLYKPKASFQRFGRQLDSYSPHLKELVLATRTPFEAHQAGQDRLIRAKGIGGNPNNQLLMVLDGHGPNGHHLSYVGGQLLFQNLERITPILVKHLEQGHQERVKPLLTWAYRHTETQMFQTDALRQRVFSEVTPNSGCTASAVMILQASGQTHLVSSNAGDSPIYLYSPTQGVTECGREHNCDCREAVTDYLQHLRARRLQMHQEMLQQPAPQQRRYEWRIEALQPKPIYWNRFNTRFGGAITLPEICDIYGNPKPLTVWKYQTDDQGVPSATVDLENYDQISKYYPVGQQSRKVPATRIREDGRQVAEEGYEADNWGSTLAGRLQVIRGLGDEYEGEHVTCEPYVSIHSLPPQATLLLASDGLTDLEYTIPLMERIHQIREEPDKQSLLYNYLGSLAQQDSTGQYTCSLPISSPDWLPHWDDLSGHVVYFP